MLLWAVAVYYLKITEDQFWAITPAQFEALVARFEENRTFENYRFGIAPSLLYNLTQKKKMNPLDFFAKEAESARGQAAKLRFRAQMYNTKLKQIKKGKK